MEKPTLRTLTLAALEKSLKIWRLRSQGAVHVDICPLCSIYSNRSCTYNKSFVCPLRPTKICVDLYHDWYNSALKPDDRATIAKEIFQIIIESYDDYEGESH